MSTPPKNKSHPNSIANLVHMTSDSAKEMNKKSQISRRKNSKLNKEMRDALKFLKQEYNQEYVDGVPKALDILRVQMAKAAQAGDMDRVADLAKAIAPYETPKLSSQEMKVEETNYSSLSLEELENRFKKLRNS